MRKIASKIKSLFHYDSKTFCYFTNYLQKSCILMNNTMKIQFIKEKLMKNL